MFVARDPTIEADSGRASSVGHDPRIGTFAGNYRLIARLGEGGMAAVYRGEHQDITGAVVAVKLLDRRLAAVPGITHRFLREAQALFELMGESRHIPRVLDYGKTKRGESYMVMEYLRGLDLAQVLQREGALPWPRVARLGLQLCDALAVAHARGILHRDIKPANCFLVQEDGVEVVKLIDFGVAKDLRAITDPTALGTIVGTPAYLAPELLIDGARPSVQSDIYSLGATLYRLLANRSHAVGQTWQDIAHHLQFTQLLPPSAHRGPDQPLSPEVDALILRALHREPAQRFASALEFAEAIRACIPAAIPARRARFAGGMAYLRRALALGVTPLATLATLIVSDLPEAEPAAATAAERVIPAAEMARLEEPSPAKPSADAPTAQTAASADPQHSAREPLVKPPTDPGRGASRAASQGPPQRRRTLRRELGSMRNAVEVCAGRHGGNLVAELAVRVRVSADGVGEHVTLPEPSGPALIACVTRAIQSRRYAPGPAAETVRHVFRLRPG